VKLLVDAQLPRRLARELAEAGHDALHTLDLPLGNRTPDEEVIKVAVRDGRIVVTKDRDFIVAFALRRLPPKLLLISTGNMANEGLWHLFAANLPAIDAAFAQHDFIELSARAIVTHV
jgi:predicted nuclease of predicted toxin-antitoxin system